MTCTGRRINQQDLFLAKSHSLLNVTSPSDFCPSDFLINYHACVGQRCDNTLLNLGVLSPRKNKSKNIYLFKKAELVGSKPPTHSLMGGQKEVPFYMSSSTVFSSARKSSQQHHQEVVRQQNSITNHTRWFLFHPTISRLSSIQNSLYCTYCTVPLYCYKLDSTI